MVMIHVGLDEFEDDDLIDELEERGFVVMHKDNGDTPDNLKIEIEKLREDFINWYQFGMKNENFEKSLKQFFLDTIDEYIN